MAFTVAHRPTQASKWGVRLRALPLLWRGGARERVGASLAARVGPPQGTFVGAPLGASQLARAGASLVCARAVMHALARMTGGDVAARAHVRVAGEPERQRALLGSPRVVCSAGLRR